MESNVIVPGMILVVRDNCRPFCQQKDIPSTHPYLVISMNNDNIDLGYAQCMKITSMKNKEMKEEIPIILNESITFVVPYNIHSFPIKALSIDSYKGFICPGLMSTSAFIDFLMEIYYSNITDKFSNRIDNFDKIKSTITEYQNTFFEKYSLYPFYRDKNNEIDDSESIGIEEVQNASSIQIIKINESIKMVE